MAEREKIISLIILSLSSFVFSFCVSFHKTVFSTKILTRRRCTRFPVEQTVLRGRADSAHFPQQLGSFTVTARHKIRALLLAEGYKYYLTGTHLSHWKPTDDDIILRSPKDQIRSHELVKARLIYLFEDVQNSICHTM